MHLFFLAPEKFVRHFRRDDETIFPVFTATMPDAG
jgi:hypothetical protein